MRATNPITWPNPVRAQSAVAGVGRARPWSGGVTWVLCSHLEEDVVTFCSSPPVTCLRDELLSAVDVVGGSGEGGVGHDVNGECGDIARLNDPTDR